MSSQKLLFNVREAAEAIGDTERAFRHKLFRAEQNGLDRCIVRLGRAVRIDPERLAEWVESLPRGGEPFQYNWTKPPGRPPKEVVRPRRQEVRP